MKLKKVITIAAVIMVFSVILCACGNSGGTPITDTQTEEEGEEGKEGVDQDTSAKNMDNKRLFVAKLSEVNDDTFVVSTRKGEFSFPRANGNPDLSGIKVGDNVAIIYKGKVSVDKEFQGELISVNKIDIFELFDRLNKDR